MSAMEARRYIQDLLIVPVGTSGSTAFFIISHIMRELTGISTFKAIAFASGIDKEFYLKNKLLPKEDIVEITEYGTANDSRRAETHYLNKKAYIKDLLSQKEPFDSVLITCFAGGGTARCAALFAKDILEECSGSNGFPKVLVVVKLPTYNSTPGMIRNSRDLLCRLCMLWEKFRDQLLIVVFSDSVGLRNLSPSLRSWLNEKGIRWPDASNAPVGDWCGTILAAYIRAQTSVSYFLTIATHRSSEYGPFSIPIICRSELSVSGKTTGKRKFLFKKKMKGSEKILGRSELKQQLLSLVDSLRSAISRTTFGDIEFNLKDTAGVYGCLWAPKVKDPNEQQKEIEEFRTALETQLKKMGAKETHSDLLSFYEETSMMDILAVLRGVRFRTSNGKVDSEEIEKKAREGCTDLLI
jgi:hypothetical protein